MCSIAAGFVASVLVGIRFGGAGLVAVEISAGWVDGIATWHCWSMGSKWTGIQEMVGTTANMTRGFGTAGKLFQVELMVALCPRQGGIF